MATSQPNLVADQTLRSLVKTFSGQDVLEDTLDLSSAAAGGPFNEIMLFLYFAPGGSQPSDVPDDTVKIEVYPSPQVPSASVFEPYATISELPVLKPFDETKGNPTLSTQASTSSTTLSVNNVTNFAVGDTIIVDDAGTNYFYRIVSISGSDLTVDRNADPNHPATTTKVKVWQCFALPIVVGARIGLRVRAENLDSGTSRDAYWQIKWSGLAGTQVE